MESETKHKSSRCYFLQKIKIKWANMSAVTRFGLLGCGRSYRCGAGGGMGGQFHVTVAVSISFLFF